MALYVYCMLSKQYLISFWVFLLCLSLIAELHVSETLFRIELQGQENILFISKATKHLSD